MKLEQLQIDLSPKSSWQCFDLGCKVALAHFKTLFSFWIVLTLPIFLIAISINLFWGFFIFWLCKPWYERGLLYILSAAVLGKKVTVLQALLHLPAHIKPLWFSSITYRRLASSRSFDMAVLQLEGLLGLNRRNRLKVLHKTKDDNTAWWTICCVHWELFLCVGVMFLIQMLSPLSLNIWDMDTAVRGQNAAQNYIFYAAYYLAIALVAPFYVAGGFIAYLNRRVILEGWDIELGFAKWKKSFAENEANNAPRRSMSSLLMVLICLFGTNVLIQKPVIAQDSLYQENLSVPSAVNNESQDVIDPVKDEASQSTTLTPAQILENAKFQAAKSPIIDDLERLLEEPPFTQSQTKTGYRFKKSDTEDEEPEKSEFDYPFIAKITKIIAQSVQFILWGLFLFVFAYLIIRNWSSITSAFDKSGIEEESEPLPSFISTVLTQNVSGDISSLVNSCINKQEYRRALSILVQATLRYLTKEQELHLTKSMTENECLAVIKRKAPLDIYTYMQGLFAAWMKMAWAHQLPSADTLQRLVDQYDVLFVDENVGVDLSHKDDLS